MCTLNPVEPMTTKLSRLVEAVGTLVCLLFLHGFYAGAPLVGATITTHGHSLNSGAPFSRKTCNDSGQHTCARMSASWSPAIDVSKQRNVSADKCCFKM